VRCFGKVIKLLNGYVEFKCHRIVERVQQPVFLLIFINVRVFYLNKDPSAKTNPDEEPSSPKKRSFEKRVHFTPATSTNAGVMYI